MKTYYKGKTILTKIAILLFLLIGNNCYAKIRSDLWLQKQDYQVEKDYYPTTLDIYYQNSYVGLVHQTIPLSWSKIFVKDQGLYVGLVAYIGENPRDYSLYLTKSADNSICCLLVYGDIYDVSEEEIPRYYQYPYSKCFIGQLVKNPLEYFIHMINKKLKNTSDNHSRLQFLTKNTGKSSYVIRQRFEIPAESASGTYSPSGRYQSSRGYTGGYTVDLDGDKIGMFTWTIKDSTLYLKQTKVDSSVKVIFDEHQWDNEIDASPSTKKILIAQRKADVPNNRHVKKYKSRAQQKLSSANLLSTGAYHVTAITEDFLCLNDNSSYYCYYVDDNNKTLQDNRSKLCTSSTELIVTDPSLIIEKHKKLYSKWKSQEEFEMEEMALKESLTGLDGAYVKLFMDFYNTEVQKLDKVKRAATLADCSSCIQQLHIIDENHKLLMKKLPQSEKECYQNLFYHQVQNQEIISVTGLKIYQQSLEKCESTQKQYLYWITLKNDNNKLNEQIIMTCGKQYADIVKIWRSKYKDGLKTQKTLNENIQKLSTLKNNGERILEYVNLKHQCDSLNNAITSHCASAKNCKRLYTVLYKELPMLWDESADNINVMKSNIQLLTSVKERLGKQDIAEFDKQLKKAKKAEEFKTALGL